MSQSQDLYQIRMMQEHHKQCSSKKQKLHASGEGNSSLLSTPPFEGDSKWGSTKRNGLI